MGSCIRDVHSSLKWGEVASSRMAREIHGKACDWVGKTSDWRGAQDPEPLSSGAPVILRVFL